MSNLSDIGFNVESEEDLYSLLEKAYKRGQPISAQNGTRYICYADPSGAEMWMQVNAANEMIGMNPHFRGKSRRTVCITTTIEREESELDGAYHAWAEPTEVDDPQTGVYPFVFDVPDFGTVGEIHMPKNFELQLAAFAQQIDYYESEEAFDNQQKEEPKFAVQSFIPTGLFTESETGPPPALGLFTATIRECEKRTNQLTDLPFYWLLADTLGGEVDVVVDPDFFDREPHTGGVIQGTFWLSGRLIDPPAADVSKRGLFRRMFRK